MKKYDPYLKRIYVRSFAKQGDDLCEFVSKYWIFSWFGWTNGVIKRFWYEKEESKLCSDDY